MISDEACPVCNYPTTYTEDRLDTVLMEYQRHCKRCNYFLDYMTGCTAEFIGGAEFFSYWDDKKGREQERLIEETRGRMILMRRLGLEMNHAIKAG